MIKRFALVAAASAAALAATAPAVAVGLGPLYKEGLTGTDRKAFYLTLINPYKSVQTFRSSAVDLNDHPIDRVRIVPEVASVAAESHRKIVVITTGLAPGEEFKFKVCAALADQTGSTINARVCSKLTARRVAAARG